MESHTVDLKQTINLPQTAFSMKANLPQAEPKMLARWERRTFTGDSRLPRRPARYILHDGPPYANGRIHLGTAFNKILKDFIVKSKTMAGFDALTCRAGIATGCPSRSRSIANWARKKAQMSAARDPPRLPQIRGEVRRSAARRISSGWACWGSWDEPVPHDERRTIRR